MKLSELERAELLENMIEDMAITTGKHVDIIINELARHYNTSEKILTKHLKLIDSKFIDETNRIVGYIDGEPIKRTTYHMAVKRIFEKMTTGLRKHEDFDPSSQEHIHFLTENTYSYLKNCDRATA